ncbi:UNVERIFIED_ORG: DNA repair protein RecN (Recombination protein N) [Xanthobacter viscosus]|uniref:DNA repair protein RecN n=1 Tax=Xanthobacter autotrophicus TaxID=280 RepID=A0A6C1KQP5_XANAU|nr:DNA repair protein RecN [Xanthobacter autotrophicus]TLX42116.1 DNA repair protein RecN [Xanthobacter autotrophicus]
MLATLSIRDIVLIEKLDLTLSEGLTVLTGETGAGKSILLDAVSLALGGRGDGALVRHGLPKGQVTLTFDLSPDHPAHSILAAAELPDEGPLVVRRIQMADGRTRASVNEETVSVQTLRLIGASLIELHGQHDDRALVDPASHRAVIDAFGGLAAKAEALGALWRAWRVALSDARAERERLEIAAREADFTRHAVEELTALAAEVGEEASLSERRTGMMRSEKIATDLDEALDAVAGGSSPVPSLAAAVRRLERRAGEAQDLVRPAVEAIDQALDALETARAHLEAALADAAFEPAELERIEERLFALRAAARKYGASVDDLPTVAARFSAELERLDQSAATLARLEKTVAEAETAYRTAAAALSLERHGAAGVLDAAVVAELPPLKLERAAFITKVTSDPASAGPDGYDQVEFWVRTNPGTRPGPLMKVASGGELSRFLLALKVVLADRGSAPTLIFDEIDTGVGGAVADAIGQRLGRLAQKVQVLCVTHAPQVAARARHHLLIAKAAAEGAPGQDGLAEDAPVTTRVAPLNATTRREEIARMLAGATVTAEARAAADRLLKAAR